MHILKCLRNLFYWTRDVSRRLRSFLLYLLRRFILRIEGLWIKLVPRFSFIIPEPMNSWAISVLSDRTPPHRPLPLSIFPFYLCLTCFHRFMLSALRTATLRYDTD